MSVISQNAVIPARCRACGSVARIAERCRTNTKNINFSAEARASTPARVV